MKELILTILITICFSIGIGWIFVRTMFEMLEIMLSGSSPAHQIPSYGRKKADS